MNKSTLLVLKLMKRNYTHSLIRAYFIQMFELKVIRTEGQAFLFKEEGMKIRAITSLFSRKLIRK